MVYLVHECHVGHCPLSVVRYIYIYNYYILLPHNHRLVGMEQHLLTINSPQVQYKRVARPFALAEKWNFQRKRLPARG